MQPAIEPLYLSDKGASTKFGISVGLLQKMRWGGYGPPWIKVAGKKGRTGGRVLYNVAQFESWLAARPGGGESAPSHSATI